MPKQEPFRAIRQNWLLTAGDRFGMYKIDLEDFVSCVIEDGSYEAFNMDGFMMTQVRRELLSVGIVCDFSPGAIDTFAYHYPGNVCVSHFEICVQPSFEFAHKMYELSVESELKNKIYPIWKRVKKQNAF